MLTLHEFSKNICIFVENFSFQLLNKLLCWRLNKFDLYLFVSLISIPIHSSIIHIGLYFVVFHGGFMPIQAVFQNPFMPAALRAPPLSYNLSTPLSIEAAKSPKMNVFSASQGSKISNPSDFSSSASLHTQKMLRLSMDVRSDRHEIVNLGASDKHELPLLCKNNAPSATLSDIVNSSETRPRSSPANMPEDDEVHLLKDVHRH